MKKFMNQTIYTLLSCCMASSAMAAESRTQLLPKNDRYSVALKDAAKRAALDEENQARLESDPDFAPTYDDMNAFSAYSRKPRKNRQSSALKTRLLSEPDDSVDAASSTDSSASASPVTLQRADSSSPVAIRHSRQASQAASEKPTTRYAELADGEELTTIDLNDNKTSQRIQPLEIERDAPAGMPGCFSAFKRACLNAWRRLTGGNK